MYSEIGDLVGIDVDLMEADRCICSGVIVDAIKEM